MYPDIPIWLSLVFLAGGLAAVAWSSDMFVAGASSLARAMGISPFVVGMVVIGFGTSAPELCVSAISGIADKANLSLGNAYGSCVFNILAILGLVAIVRPIAVKPLVAFFAAPLLVVIAVLSWFLVSDGVCSRIDAAVLLVLFAMVMPAYCFMEKGNGQPAAEAEGAADESALRSSVRLLVGLVALVGASHVLVWGAVDFAKAMGVSDLLIGLTIVAVGTSLPELASAIASARRGENDFVIGNIVGSNIFNSLAVVGISSAISPATGFSKYILYRDLPVVAFSSALVLVLGLRCFGGRIGRVAGFAFAALFVAYSAVMLWQELSSAGA